MCEKLLDFIEEYFLEGYYNYEWGQEGYCIIDDDGFSNDFNKCLKKVLKFFTEGFYIEVADCFYMLLQIIEKFNEYFSDEIFDYNALYDESYIAINERDIALHYYFSILQAQDFCDVKLGRLYEVLINCDSRINDVITLKDIPIPHFNDFLSVWKEYLLSSNEIVSYEIYTTSFIHEIVLLEDDEKSLKRYISKGVKITYPYYCLVEYCFNKKSYSDVIKYAKEAISKKLTKEHMDNITDILIQTSLIISDMTLYKESILEKFINNCCIDNFIRRKKI